MGRGFIALLVLCLLVGAPLVPWGAEQGARGPGTAVPGYTAPPSADEVLDAPDITSALSSIAPCFVENKGQVSNPDVRFYARGNPLSVGLTPTGVICTLTESCGDGPDDPLSTSMPSLRSTGFSMAFEGCEAVEPVGVGECGGRTNVFRGDDPSGWVRGARGYAEVLYGGLYPGIDARFYFRGGMLKYEFAVGAGADPGVIAMVYRGIEPPIVDGGTGELLLATSIGTIRDARPEMFDGQTGVPLDQRCRYMPLADGRVRFQLPDGRPTGRPLIIDPGLEYCSFLGGSRYTFPRALAIDRDSTVLICGYTDSSDFPTPEGSNVTPPVEGDDTVYVTRLSSDLTIVLNTTFIGGEDGEDARDIVIQGDGHVVIAGGTNSKDFPLLDPLFQWARPGSQLGTFIVRLDHDLVPLTSTLLCGTERSSIGEAIAADEDGNVLVAGLVTNTTDFPVTTGAYRTEFPPTQSYPEDMAGYVAKFNGPVSALLYCTFIECMPSDMAIDGQGDAYVAGTILRGFRGTPGAYCETLSEAHVHGCVMGLDPTGAECLAATLLGGSDYDFCSSIELATNGSVLVAGSTASTDFPVQSHGYMGGNADAFLCMLDRDLSRLQYSACLGGSDLDQAADIEWAVMDEVIYIAGGTSSSDLPTTLSGFDGTNRGVNDLFFMGINLTSDTVHYCTYFGGASDDGATDNCLKLNDEGKLVFAFYGDYDVPLTENARHRTGFFGMVAILDPAPQSAPGLLARPRNLRAVAGEGRVDLSWDPPTCMTTRNIWHRIYRSTAPNGEDALVEVPSSVLGYADLSVTNGTRYYYRIKAFTYLDESPFSDEVTARPLGTPTAPRDLDARTGNGTITLTWGYPQGDGGGLTGFRIYKQEPVGGATWTIGWRNETTWVDAEVVVGTRYQYQLSAYNAWGESPLTDIVMQAALDTPSAVTSYKAVEGDGRVELSWGLPTSLGGVQVLGGYYLVKRDAAGGVIWNKTLTIFDLSLIDLEVSNGHEYVYEIAAFSSVGTGRWLSASAVPYGAPSPPRLLQAAPGDGEAVLTWSTPSDPNGRDVARYKVYFGTSQWDMTSTYEAGNRLKATVTGLTNGVTYYFAVSALNTLGDESERTDPVACTPVGVPGPPEGLDHENLWEGVRLTWRDPRQMGGASTLAFVMMRGSTEGSLVDVARMNGTYEYVDTNVTVGGTYFYAVKAASAVGEGPACDTIKVVFLRVPSVVRDLVVSPKNGRVELRWAAPASDGGTPVFVYVVYRNLVESPLQEIARVPVGEFNGTYVDDAQVINGKRYYYAVRAQNAVGLGLPSDTLTANPFSPPSIPGNLRAIVKGSTVELTWSAPIKAGSAPVTGYAILRSTKRGELQLLVEVGLQLNYTDTTIKKGTTYYYAVVANSLMGPGNRTGELEVETGPGRVGTFLTMPFLLAIVIVLAIIGSAYAYSRSQRKALAPVPATEEEAPSEELVVSPVLAEAPEAAPSYIVEEVLVVYRDGRLIADCAREECKTEDADLMSGMLIAVQGIIQDGLERGGELESIKYGEKLVLMAGGSHVNLAVVVFGEPDEELKDALATTIQRIETSYAGIIEEWDGDLAVREGMEDLVRPLIERTKDVTKDAITRPAVAEAVTLLSAVDFHRGYVRLKVATVNGSSEAVIDAAIEVHYNHDMLRLERVEPSTLKLLGDRASIGNVKPGERATVAFLFDPQICQGTHIDGHLMYYDAKGGVHRIEMKRRTADVVCPIFFTKEHANTAMLRRLIKERLKATDMKMFRYPMELSPEVVLGLGRAAIGDRDVQLVREYVRKGPPFYAEVWYFGETKVKRQQLVMRLGVVEEQRALEFFAASTSMEPVTGLLAEFRRELDEVVLRDHSGLSMELERDEGLRRELAEREMMLDLIFGEEAGEDEGGMAGSGNGTGGPDGGSGSVGEGTSPDGTE